MGANRSATRKLRRSAHGATWRRRPPNLESSVLADEFEFSLMESVETQFEEILVAEPEDAGEQAADFSVDALCAIAFKLPDAAGFCLAHHSRRNPQA